MNFYQEFEPWMWDHYSDFLQKDVWFKIYTLNENIFRRMERGTSWLALNSFIETKTNR